MEPTPRLARLYRNGTLICLWACRPVTPTRPGTRAHARAGRATMPHRAGRSGAGGCVVLAITVLVAALLLVPWCEPADRAERLLRAWRGHDRESPIHARSRRGVAVQRKGDEPSRNARWCRDGGLGLAPICRLTAPTYPMAATPLARRAYLPQSRASCSCRCDSSTCRLDWVTCLNCVDDASPGRGLPTDRLHGTGGRSRRSADRRRRRRARRWTRLSEDR